MTRTWGLEVDRVELAVEAVLQPPPDGPAGPSLDSTLQQLALHFLGGSLSSGGAGTPPPGPGETLEDMSSETTCTAPIPCSWTLLCSACFAQLFRAPESRAE